MPQRCLSSIICYFITTKQNTSF